MESWTITERSDGNGWILESSMGDYSGEFSSAGAARNELAHILAEKSGSGSFAIMLTWEASTNIGRAVISVLTDTK